MKAELIQAPKEYNEIMRNLFNDLEVVQGSNKVKAYWTEYTLTPLREPFNKLLKNAYFSDKERLFLEYLNEIIFSKIGKQTRIKIQLSDVTKMTSLSIEASIERINLIKENILDSAKEIKDLENYRKIIFILGSISYLLQRIEVRLESNTLNEDCLKDLGRLSLVLLNVFDFLLKEVTDDDYLEASLYTIKEVGVKYFELEEVYAEEYSEE